jgi:hypothetical protein
MRLAANEVTQSFCEEDYAVTRYMAEFISTLTNLAYGMPDCNSGLWKTSNSTVN